jgi:TATA-binding protein-associated factor Taf7
MPGDDSLIAPNWIPWSERLADYKALQAELEAQAALEAEENDDSDDDEDADEAEEAESADENEAVAEAELTPELADVSPDAEQDSDDAGGRIPRFLRRRLGRLKNKKQ